MLLNRCIFFPGIGPKKGIDVFNNTYSVLYVAYSFSDSLGNGNPLVLYEEVIIDNKKILRYPCYRIDADSVGCIGIPGRESLLLRCDDNILRLFIILESTMRDYSWEEICEKQMYVKKLSFTKEDLEITDWTVVYE
jgi:hypothetical protein